MYCGRRKESQLQIVLIFFYFVCETLVHIGVSQNMVAVKLKQLQISGECGGLINAFGHHHVSSVGKSTSSLRDETASECAL